MNVNYNELLTCKQSSKIDFLSKKKMNNRENVNNQLPSLTLKKSKFKTQKISKNLIALRSKVDDWLILVTNETNQSDYTYFRTVFLIDQLLIKNDPELTVENLHLTCIVSLFIASKLEEPKPLKLKNIQKNIAHNKYTKEEILNCEKQILKKLNYKLGNDINLLDTIFQIVYNFDSYDQDDCNADLDYFTKIKKERLYDSTIYIAKAISIDFKASIKLFISKKMLFGLVYYCYFERNFNCFQEQNMIDSKRKYILFAKQTKIKYERVLKYSLKVEKYITFLKVNKDKFPFVNRYEEF
jgi:hypothetical protein